MSLFYNVAFLIFGILYLPFFLLKMRQAENPKRLIRERLGIFDKSWSEKFLGKKVVWIHAVSVGEVLAVQRLLEDLLVRLPECHFVLSTVTPTGQRIAQKMAGDHLTVCYFPFDLTWAVKSFFKTLGPECLLLVETEIWPNLLTQARRFHVPIGVLNARLSARSVGRYLRFFYIFKPLFALLDFVLVQSDQDGERFKALGVDPSRIQVLGNMKFDNAEKVGLDECSAPSLKQSCGFLEGDRILVAGSTHPGEEEILWQVREDLLKDYPSLKLLVAPRHIERSEKIAEFYRKKGLRVKLTTDKDPEPEFDCLILNQLGVLKKLYAMADVVYVGGSLVRHGGQNPIEAANFKRPILHGPHVFNFENIYRQLDQEGGAILVSDEFQFAFAMKRLLGNTSEAEKLGARAYAIIEKLRGATHHHVEWLLKFLSSKTQTERMNHVQVPENLLPSSR